MASFTRAAPPHLPAVPGEYSPAYFSKLNSILTLFFTQLGAVQPVNIAGMNIDISTLPTEADWGTLREGDVYLNTTDGSLHIKDGNMNPNTALDAFGRLRVSNATSLFDSQQEYGLNTLFTWDAAANGTLAAGSANGSAVDGSNAVGPTNTSTRLTPITVSTTSGHYAVLQSKQYVRYIPGKGQSIFITGVFSPGTVANLDARSGYFDSANGQFLKVTNGVATMVNRTSTSGAAVDMEVLQTAWNIDTFDGSGPSGITLDLTKTQILFISAQWLGVGRVVMGFDIDGNLSPAHAFKNANSLLTPYTQTFNLPVRMELRNTGASAGGTIQFCCVSVQSDGGTDVRGYSFSAPATVITKAVTTRRPVLSIRPKATFNSRTNRAHIEDLEYLLRATTNDALYEVVLGGTLTGAAFTSANTDSVAEFDTTATAISGGTVLSKGFVISGSGATASVVRATPDIRNPLVLSQIDALAATQTAISLVCTSFTGTSNVTSLINWSEQSI